MRRFVTGLEQAARDYVYKVDTDNQIRDEVLCKCRSEYIKQKLLEEGPSTLGRTVEISEQCEKVEPQIAALFRDESAKDSVNRVNRKFSGERNDFNKKGRRAITMQ